MKIEPLFSRLVIFRTTDFSYHGYTDPIRSPFSRRSVSMYHNTNGRPTEEKIDPDIDTHARQYFLAKSELRHAVRRLADAEVHDVEAMMTGSQMKPMQE